VASFQRPLVFPSWLSSFAIQVPLRLIAAFADVAQSNSTHNKQNPMRLILASSMKIRPAFKNWGNA
jgi:hypothetical protein